MFIYAPRPPNPLVYFLEPVVRAVSYARDVLGMRRIDMIGISGGGWTTTLSAAIDPRIRVSVPVAGSLPLYMRTPPCATPGDVGDAGQHEPTLLALASYLDLYVLGAHGRGRAQLQVLNQYDSNCFAGVRYRTYSEMLKAVVRGLHGRWDVFLDSSHQGHQISSHALDVAILPFLRRRRL